MLKCFDVRVRTTAVLVGLSLALTGCGGGDEEAGPTTVEPTTTTAVEETTTTTEAVTTTTSLRPLLENTGEDHAAIFMSLMTYAGSLDTAPDPTRVADVYEAGTELHRSVLAVVTELHNNGWHWSDNTESISEIVVTSVLNEDLVLVSALSTRSSVTLLDEAGSAAEPQPPPPPAEQARFAYTLRRGGDGRWRIAETTLLEGGS